jgi:ATP-dependent Clp protease ATP-binding subunit ClpA
VVELVVDKLVAELEDQLYARRVSISLGDGARKWLAEHGYNRRFGARPMARLIDKEIRRKLADEILFGQIQEGGVVTVDAEGGELTFSFEQQKAPARKPAKVT